MKLWVRVAGPGLGIGGAVMQIILLGLGEPQVRVLEFAWPALMIIWAVLILQNWRLQRLNRQTIDLQAAVIREQSELLMQILTRHDR